MHAHRLVGALSLLVALMPATEAHGQDVRRLVEGRLRNVNQPPSFGESLDSATIGRLRLCADSDVSADEAQAFLPFLRLVDLNGDGRKEVVYSGPNSDPRNCWRGEGVRTVVWWQGPDSMVQLFMRYAAVVQLTPPTQGTGADLVLFSPSCCDDVVQSWILMRFVRNVGSPRASVYDHIMTTRMALEAVPQVWLDSPRRFSVGAERYNMRYEPGVDDTVLGPVSHIIVDRPGNVMVTYGRGARGLAVAESRSRDGRTWWLVLMEPDSTAVPVVPPTPEDSEPIPARWLGWMSDRYLSDASNRH